MPEDTTTATTDTATQSATDTSQVDKQTDDGGSDEIKRLRAEAAKYRVLAKENAQKAKDHDAYVESQKTELQREAEARAQAEKERDEARLDALRVKVGAAKKLPAEVVDLLKGDTEEELTAHADRLAEHFKQSVRPSGSADQGPRGTAPPAGPAKEFADFLQGQLRQ